MRSGTGTGTGEDGRSEARREAILEAAVECFTSYGFRRTSLEDIARQAGISRTGVYHHFSSKEGVFLAAVEHCHAESHRQALARIDPDNPLEDQIFGALDGKMGYLYRRAVSTRHGAQVAGMSSDLGAPVTQLWGAATSKP